MYKLFYLNNTGMSYNCLKNKQDPQNGHFVPKFYLKSFLDKNNSLY